MIGGIAKRDIHLKSRQKLHEQFIGSPIRVFDGNNAVAGREQGKQLMLIGRIPLAKLVAASAPSRLRTFSSNAATVGISVAPVDVAGTATERDFEPVFNRLVAERNAQRNGDLRCIGPALTLFLRTRRPVFRGQERQRFSNDS